MEATVLDYIGNTLSTDYRAELLAAMLVETGIPMEQVRLIRLGSSQKGKRVGRIEKTYSQDEMIDFVNVYERKRDLYESLPEGLFHKNGTKNGKGGPHSVTDLMKQTRQEAFNARLFFRPFEMEIDRMSMLAQLYELCLEKRDKYSCFVRLMSHYWPLLRDFQTDRALVLVYFIALSHRPVGVDKLGQLFSLFLNCRVTVEKGFEFRNYSVGSEWLLGSSSLGAASVLGGMVTMGLPVVRVRIEKVARDQVSLFYRDSQSYKNLEKILNLFVPADAELQIEVFAEEREASFSFSSEGRAPILGYTTLLS